jgi:hypothetical protein
VGEIPIGTEPVVELVGASGVPVPAGSAGRRVYAGVGDTPTPEFGSTTRCSRT